MTRRTALVGGLGGVLALAGCGSGGSPFTPGRTSGAVGAAELASISDTADNRLQVVVNDLAKLWRTAGLSGQPHTSDRVDPDWVQAGNDLLGSSPIGSGSWVYANAYPKALGYDPVAVTREVCVGNPPATLSLAVVEVDADAVEKALAPLEPTVTDKGSTRLLDLGATTHLDAPEPLGRVTLGLRYLAIGPNGDRIAAGGVSTSPDELVALAAGTTVSGSLADNDDVAAVLAELGPDQESVLVGTGPIRSTASLLGPAASPAELEQLRRKYGLDKVSVTPTLVGAAVQGGSLHAPKAGAVAVYASADQAKTAASVMGRLVTDGSSLQTKAPYRSLWQVTDTRVHDNRVVVDLTTAHPGVLAQAVDSGDFPLFWGT